MDQHKQTITAIQRIDEVEPAIFELTVTLQDRSSRVWRMSADTMQELAVKIMQHASL